MRKTIVVILSVLLLPSIWVWSFAGIPPSLGLPTVNISSADNNKWNISGSGISNTSVTMNNGSVMCVDCHTRNPGYFAPLASFPGGTRSLNFVGSHFVTNTYADTNTGGGYAGSVSGARSNQYYIKYDAWTTTNKMSKYGKVTSGSLFSDNTSGVGVTGRHLPLA